MNKVIRPLRLSDLKRRSFHIDVSREQPFVVQPELRKEISLTSLSAEQLDQLRSFAAGQLRRGTVEQHEAVDEYRATLFYLNRWSPTEKSVSGAAADRNARPGKHGASKAKIRSQKA